MGSRKTCFEWEQRGLAALLDGVTDQGPGRPEKPDTTTEKDLEKQLAELERENQLLEQKMALKDLAFELNLRSPKDRAKKNKQIHKIMGTIETLKSQYSVDQASLATAAGISVSSYKRYKRRIRCGDLPVNKPGVKKVVPIDLEALKQQIQGLNHGKHRTSGTGMLFLVNRHGISRTDFNEMVRQVRTATNRSSAAALCHVRWLHPDLAGALDGMQYISYHIQNLQDLCSRYKFAPMTSAYMPCGEEIAGHLDRHLIWFSPPLFLKRDNGGNLNHRMIDTLLEDLLIIPINSPCYSASYNGAIEHSQGELKSWIRKWKPLTKTNREIALLVENAVHALNHHPWRSLAGSNACRTYFTSNRLRYTKRQRRQAWDWIRDLAADISAKCSNLAIDPAAWRIWTSQFRTRTWRKSLSPVDGHLMPGLFNCRSFETPD